MTTKYLTGAYPGGYALKSNYTGLVIGTGASVGGTGVSASFATTITNVGNVSATGDNPTNGGTDISVIAAAHVAPPPAGRPGRAPRLHRRHGGDRRPRGCGAPNGGPRRSLEPDVLRAKDDGRLTPWSKDFTPTVMFTQLPCLAW